MRLKDYFQKTFGYSNTCFNSKVVRLKAPMMRFFPTFKPSFNSKVVRLKGFLTEEIEVLSYSFNSKVVRLKVMPYQVELKKNAEFQFQSGAVKSDFANGIFQKRLSFNSKVVRLKVGQLAGVRYNIRSFNSKVVRLKVHRFRRTSFMSLMFQFQSGAVKRNGVKTPSVKPQCFNSKVVRLKGHSMLLFYR